MDLKCGGKNDFKRNISRKVIQNILNEQPSYPEYESGQIK